jgi:cation transport ATPase
MTNNEILGLVKQAYAYGAATALQEFGVSPSQAEQTALKLAAEHEDDGGHPIAGALGGAAAGGALSVASNFLPGRWGVGGRAVSRALKGKKPRSAAGLGESMKDIGQRGHAMKGSQREGRLRAGAGAGVGALGGAIAGSD